MKRSISHPDFNSLTMDYDYSLVELEKEIRFDRTKRPITLHGQNEQVADKTMTFISGWGSTQKTDESNRMLRAGLQTTPTK